MDTVLCKISGYAEQGMVSGLPCFVSLEFLYLARDQTRPTSEAHNSHRLSVELLGFLLAGDVWLRV